MRSFTLPEILGALAGLISLATLKPYLRHIRENAIRPGAGPSLSGWLIWAFLGFVSLAAFFMNDKQGDALWMVAVSAINPTVVATALWHHGHFRKPDPTDWVCLVAGVGAGALMLAQRDAEVAIWICIVGDLFASGAMMRSILRDPSAEPWRPWAAFTFASALNLGAADYATTASAVYPVYVCLASVILTAPIVRAHSLRRA